MTAFLTKPDVGGSVVLHEESVIFCREGRIYHNGGSTVVQLRAGEPFVVNAPCTHTNINTCDGLLIEPKAVQPGETVEVAVLARGPAVVNQDALPTIALDTVAFNMTTFLTAVSGLGILLITEPATTTELTT